MNDSICLYICKRDEEGALLRYNFDPQACVLTKMGTEDALRYADCANIAAALSITRRGGIPSMPRREEIVGTILQMKGNKRLYEA